MKGQLLSPSNVSITGTLEVLRGVAGASWKKQADGTLEPEYEGGTEVWWDESRTVARDGVTVVVDEDGNEWSLAACTFVPEGEDVAA